MAESCDNSISSRLPLPVHITNLYAHEARSNRLRRDTIRNIEDPNDSERVSKQVKTEEEGISEEKTGLTSDDLTEDTGNLSSYREGMSESRHASILTVAWRFVNRRRYHMLIPTRIQNYPSLTLTILCCCLGIDCCLMCERSRKNLSFGQVIVYRIFASYFNRNNISKHFN